MTSPTTPDLQNPTPPVAPQAADRTPDNPMQGTPQQAQQAAGLTDEDKENLIKVMNHFKYKWSFNHRENVRKVSKVFEYIRDRQYIYWDSFSGKYVDPFASDGSQQGGDEVWGYRYVNNVMQWLLKVFQSTLSPAIPKTRFWPVDAENDQDVTSAETASKAQGNIERKNNVGGLLLQELMYLFCAGNYFKYTRWTRDKVRWSTNKEPVWTLTEQEIKPARYACPSCGQEVSEDQVPAMKSLACPSCGTKLDAGDFQEPVTAMVPKIAAMEDVPNGGVAWSIYNTLHVMVAPDHTDPSIDPINSTPILALDDEIDLSTLRAGYPEAWDMLKSSNVGSTAGGDAEFGRLARTRNYSAAPNKAGTLNEQRVTLTRCWIRETAFNILDKQEDAQRLQELFPDGCKLVTVGDKFLECIPEKMSEHWTWCGTMKGLGAYPPAVADPAIPFQDRINDTANNIHNYMDRLASPDILANVDLIDVEAWNGQQMSGGGIKPIKLKRSTGATNMEGAFFQPEFHIDSKIFNYTDVLMQTLQLLIGTTPQTYGGHQQGIDTKGGQEQALQVATSILEIYWKLITEEHANSAKLAVKCLAENAIDDINSVVDEEDISGERAFKNDPIAVSNLQGEFNCYPDTDQGMPVAAQEWQKRLQEIFLAAKDNPLVAELFQPLANRRLAMKAWAPPGMEPKGQDTWKAVMIDLSNLMQSGPLPPNQVDTPMGPQMIQLPSVQPQKGLYDMEAAKEACTAWGLKNWHTTLQQNPPGRENFLLYLKLVSQYQAEESAPPMPPPGAPQAAQA